MAFCPIIVNGLVAAAVLAVSLYLMIRSLIVPAIAFVYVVLYA